MVESEGLALDYGCATPGPGRTALHTTYSSANHIRSVGKHHAHNDTQLDAVDGNFLTLQSVICHLSEPSFCRGRIRCIFPTSIYTNKPVNMSGEKLRQRSMIKMTVKWWSVLVTLACCSIHRAASNDSGAVPDLIEMPNPALDPKPADLNVTALLANMGTKFDQNYMSILTPEHMVPVYDIPFRRNRHGRLVPTGKIPKEIRKLYTKYFSLADGRRQRTQVSSQLRRKIQQYLWGRTACPLRRQWKDLGQRFWPRWLLKGYCSKGKKSCSIPAGMYCRATVNQYKTLLRWHCHAKYNHLPGTGVKVCKWIEVQYPVVTRCGCGCASNDCK